MKGNVRKIEGYFDRNNHNPFPATFWALVLRSMPTLICESIHKRPICNLFPLPMHHNQSQSLFFRSYRHSETESLKGCWDRFVTSFCVVFVCWQAAHTHAHTPSLMLPSVELASSSGTAALGAQTWPGIFWVGHTPIGKKYGSP